MAIHYIADVATGAEDGSSPSDRADVAWFNSVANWGAGAAQISPGDTVSVGGTITSLLNAAGSGSEGLPITILFEENAKISTPAQNSCAMANKSYLVWDGGVNGVIENTDNGSVLGNQLACVGMTMSGAHHIEVKNLWFKNQYVHTDPDDYFAGNKPHCIYANPWISDISIHDCKFSENCWCVTLLGADGSNGLRVYNNEFSNYDHGVAGIGGSQAGAAVTDIEIYGNTFGDTANWDTTLNVHHHDGIHIYYATGCSVEGLKIYDNYFYGDWGINNTAHIYIEGYQLDGRSGLIDFEIYNNLLITPEGGKLNNGHLVGGGVNWKVFNNTFLGGGEASSLSVSLVGEGSEFKNNVVSGSTTLLSITETGTGSVDGNVYADLIPSGNSPWYYNGTGYASFSAWKTAVSDEANSWEVPDAGLSALGVPEAGSAVIGAGFDLSAYFTTDFAGATRVAPWDIGALAYDGAPPATPPSAPTNLTVTAI